MLAVSGNTFGNLHCKFSGRRQHQGADVICFDLGACGQALQQGECKTGRFAGAGLCCGQNILARENHRNRLDLDRRGFRITTFINGAQNEFRETKGRE